MPDITIQLGFNPLDCGCETTAEVFRDDVARTFYLLWRRNHITSQYFVGHVLPIANLIRATAPKTPSDLINCIRGTADIDFNVGDVRAWVDDALPYFTGEKTIDYEVAAVAEEGE